MNSLKVDKLKSKINKHLLELNSSIKVLNLVRNEFEPQRLGLFINGLYFFDNGEEKNIPVYMQTFLMEQNIKFRELRSIIKFINKNLQCAVLVLDYGKPILDAQNIRHLIYGKNPTSCCLSKILTIKL